MKVFIIITSSTTIFMYLANMNEHYTHVLNPGVQSPEVKKLTEKSKRWIKVKEPLPHNVADRKSVV